MLPMSPIERLHRLDIIPYRIGGSPRVTCIASRIFGTNCCAVGTEHTLSVATRHEAASTVVSAQGCNEPVAKRSKRSSTSNKDCVWQSGGEAVEPGITWLNLNDVKSLPPIHAKNMPSESRAVRPKATLIPCPFCSMCTRGLPQQKARISRVMLRLPSRISRSACRHHGTRVVRNETSLRQLKQAIGEQHGEGLNHPLGYQIQPTYDEVWFDRIERLRSQMRSVGISRIQGHSGDDEAVQWKPSDVPTAVLVGTKICVGARSAFSMPRDPSRHKCGELAV